MEDEASPQEHDSPGSWINEEVGAIFVGLACCKLLLMNGVSLEERKVIEPKRERLRGRLRELAPEETDWWPMITYERFRLEQGGKSLWDERLDQVVEEVSPAATAMMS